MQYIHINDWNVCLRYQLSDLSRVQNLRLPIMELDKEIDLWSGMLSSFHVNKDILFR